MLAQIDSKHDTLSEGREFESRIILYLFEMVSRINVSIKSWLIQLKRKEIKL